MSRRLLSSAGIAAALCVLGGTAIRATGNLEVITQSGTAIGTRVWHANSIPVVWRFNDPAVTAGCNYSSTTAPPATLQPAIAAGFTSWQNNPDSKIAFSYGGTTTTKNIGADGVNVVTFCSSTAFASGVIASTPSTALTAPTTVTAGGGCPVGQGIIPGLTFCFPVGTYPAGTIVDADIQFNTSNPATMEQSLSTGDPNVAANAGKYDVQAISTHEEGHFEGLSHDPIFQAVMYAFIDDNPFSDGMGQRVLKRSDLAISSHYYPETTFSSNFGSITGFISLDASAADGVHVAAIDPNTMLGVEGRFSLSRFEDPAALGGEGTDFTNNGGGFYRIDGLPPGNYYVYVEYFDDTDFFTGRLLNRYNVTVANSSVAIGCNTADPNCTTVAGDYGFVPALTEFYNTGDSGNGGNGVSAGTAADNSDTASLVPVIAGSVTSGIDIAINIEPVNGQTPTQRQNPTSRSVIFNDNLQGTDVIKGFILNGGNDDFYAIRYPAASLPAPPYNIAEGLWVRAGKNDMGYGVRLTYGSPTDPNRPAINDPIVPSAGRVLSGGPGGKTDAGDDLDIRDQWNVTINQSRDIWIVMNQPPTPSGATLISQGYFILVTQTSGGLARVNRTLFTENGGTTWTALNADTFYSLIVETTPPVNITSASPASGVEGATLDVIINGVGFQNGATIDFGSNIVVNSVTFLSATQLRANVTIACTGATSSRDVNVKVTNPGVVFPDVSRVFTVTPAINDTDCDGVTNALDCAPSDATLKHPATEVQNDTVTLVGPSTVYSWDSQDALNGTATSYDVVTGLMGDVLVARDFSAATCGFNDLADTPFTDPNPDPAPGTARYFLVRARNGCNAGPGTYGDSSLVPDPRDALDAGAPCP